MRSPDPAGAPFVREVLGEIIAGKGDLLPVSAFPVDGTYPTGTTQYEKRNITLEIPGGIPSSASSAASVPSSARTPSSARRSTSPSYLEGAPQEWMSTDPRWKQFPGMRVLAGGLRSKTAPAARCVWKSACQGQDPGRAQGDRLVPQPPIRERENINWDTGPIAA